VSAAADVEDALPVGRLLLATLLIALAVRGIVVDGLRWVLRDTRIE
jgi:hypothetical protein